MKIRGLFSQVNAFLHSVRFRLAVWFAFILAVVLVFFSIFVYYRTAQDVRDQTAARLVSRLREMNTAILHEYRDQGEGDFWNYPGFNGGSPFTLQDYEILVLSDVNGKVAGAWGSIETQQSQDVADQTNALASGKASSRFILMAVQAPNQKTGTKVDFLFNLTPILSENHILGWVILGQPLDPSGQLPRLFWTLLLAGILTLLVAIGGAYWLADRALWPVKAITQTAQDISETDLSRRLNIHSQDELGRLAGTFDRMLARLEAAFNRQRQFTADASHELRTPLTIIGLETGRALSSGRTVEEYRRSLQVIKSENEFMTRLVGELLTLARMDAGQVMLNREKLDLSDLALEVVERHAQLAKARDIQLQTGELPELPILGDRTYLAQMISNLVDNAIKYSPHGDGHWVRVETRASISGELPAAVLSVADNGSGIAAEHLPHLFERFYRVDSARSHNPTQESSNPEEIPGSGLGLAITQWIAQVHGGSITVQSQPGSGTVFEIRIPLARTTENSPEVFPEPG